MPQKILHKLWRQQQPIFLREPLPTGTTNVGAARTEGFKAPEEAEDTNLTRRRTGSGTPNSQRPQPSQRLSKDNMYQCTYKKSGFTKEFVIPNVEHGGLRHGNRTCRMQTPSSREAKTCHKELAGNYPGQLGSGSSSGFQNPLRGTTLSNTTPDNVGANHGRPSRDGCRDTVNDRKTGNSNINPQRGFHFQHVPGPQKRRWPEASNQPKTSKRICTHRTLQNGRYSCGEGHNLQRGLDGKSRPQGRLFCSPDPQGSQTIPEISISGDDLSISMPPLWSVLCSLGIYQGDKTLCGTTAPIGGETSMLHRRHPDNGRVSGDSSGPGKSTDFPVGKSGVHSKPQKVCPRTHTEDGISGLHGGLNGAPTQSTPSEAQEDPIRGQRSVGSSAYYCKKTISVPRETDSSHQGNSPGPTILQGTPKSPQCESRRLSPGLQCHPHNLGGDSVRTDMVGTPPPGVEWQVNDDPSPLTDHRVRRVKERVGGSLFGTENGGAMVNERTVMAHQLPRGVGSVPSGQVLCQGQAGNHDPTEDRQHDISRLHQQSGGDSVPQYEQDSQRTMAVVSPEGHSPPSGASSGCAKHNSGRGIQSDERQVRLDARPESLPNYPSTNGSTVHRSICIETDNTVAELLQLETGPRGNSLRCISSELEHHSGPLICQPSMATDREGTEQSDTRKCVADNCDPCLESTTMVPSTSIPPDRLPISNQSEPGPNPTNIPTNDTGGRTSTSCVVYLRKRFSDQQISKEGTELLLASWRQKSAKSYDSLFNKWVCWCNQRSTDPISGPISEVANFLADLFQKGYEYRSLNAYRSAISSVHTEIEGCSVGQHPLISRILKGAFNSRPPKPRYETTWDVAQVLRWMENLGPNDSLSIADLSHKLTMLLCLTRPMRSSDLAQLDLRFRRYLPEGVCFQSSGLAKNAQQLHEQV